MDGVQRQQCAESRGNMCNGEIVGMLGEMQGCSRTGTARINGHGTVARHGFRVRHGTDRHGTDTLGTTLRTPSPPSPTSHTHKSPQSPQRPSLHQKPSPVQCGPLILQQGQFSTQYPSPASLEDSRTALAPFPGTPRLRGFEVPQCSSIYIYFPQCSSIYTFQSTLISAFEDSSCL